MIIMLINKTMTTLQRLLFVIFIISTTITTVLPHYTTTHALSPTPIDASGWPDRFPAKEHCSKCGLCEVANLVPYVTEACPFLGDGMSRIDAMEQSVHGRRRQTDSDEVRWGVLHQPMVLARSHIQQAQWTGCVTTIALAMLEQGHVDAVVCIGGSFANPQPLLAKTRDQVLQGRGVKPALAPSLAVLDQVCQDPSITRLLFCGVGCAVQAFRAIQHTLQLEQVYVLGTNCADNSPTPQAAQAFVQDGVGVMQLSSTVMGYEFAQDFRVHIKTTDQDYLTKPYFSLPGTLAKTSIAPSCLTCMDYTNALADVVVGYMGAPLEGRMTDSWQTLSIRNDRGAFMVQKAGLTIQGPATGKGPHETLTLATVRSDGVVKSLLGEEVSKQGMPDWSGHLVASVLTRLGPKGVAFARYSVDYHLLRNYLYVLHEWGDRRAHQHMPTYARQIVKHYQDTDAGFRELCQRVLVTSQKQ